MKKLWEFTQSLKEEEDEKRTTFLLIHTLLWFMIPFLFYLLAGAVFGFSTKWYEVTFCIVGYLALGMGFFGGCIFLMRNT